MKEKELKELKLTKNIIIPFPNFQPNTIISPTQINDNFEEIEYAYNNLIDLHNGVISKVEDSLNRSDEAIDRVQGVENDLQDSERKRILNENTRITNESVRISSENIRIENENTRNSKESTRIANETQREQQELERISTYQTHINDEIKREEKHNQMIGTFNEKVGELDEAIASIPTKQELKGEKGDKGDKGDVGEKGEKGDTPSITHLETSINNKINDVETRFNKLTSSQQQDAEVIDARDGETSLKARLDRDIEKAKQVYVNVGGSHISTDSSVGYLKDVEILGNTIQDTSNLADIRSVGDKIEGQELYEIPVLSCGKNLANPSNIINDLYVNGTASTIQTFEGARSIYFKVKANTTYIISFDKSVTRNMVGVTSGIPKSGDNCDFLSVNTVELTKRFSFSSKTSGYALFYYSNVPIEVNIQIEEGTQATPYEPYQEDKLTILSPVQLEKVGDVRDRIICKDGVWGVEKNIETVVFDGTVVHGDVSSSFPSDNSSMFLIRYADVARDSILICNKFSNKDISSSYNRNVEGVFVSVNGDATAFYFRIFNDKLSTQDVAGFKQWLSENNVTIKYKTINPTFIPLPHDQQVKLRTFANKTNISFLTEIEGTIKAQVPKSLGATVNTHTEQISNLNKELDRVKKLEESTVSTVETESDFTTVEATSNGYFEDVKLEGKTLVNLFNIKSLDIINEVNIYVSAQNYELTKGKEVTLVNNTDKAIIYDINKDSGWFRSYILNANTCVKATLKEGEFIKCCYGAGARGWDVNSESDKEKLKKTCIILEGDHTQNPPSYFEGLKSVGQDVDEIVVSSGKSVIMETNSINPNDGQDITLSQRIRSVEYLEYNVNGIKLAGIDLSKYSVYYFLYDENKNYIRSSNDWVNSNCFKFSVDGKYYRFVLKRLDSVNFSPSDVNIIDTHQADKKRLLFYNNETQTWEKPILREWDSIEKHSDGKYYYHQRSGEVVLNGSENWSPNSINTVFYNNVKLLNAKTPISNSLSAYIPFLCDRLVPTNIDTIYNNNIVNGIGISKDSNIGVSVNGRELDTFKQWLQTNNVTVVYQLVEEKVYECTNIDLITYANETNYIVESGVIVPRTTLKVHNNISNVVKILQEKVSLLENKFIMGLKQVLAGDMYSLAELLYPEDFTSENTVDVPTLLI